LTKNNSHQPNFAALNTGRRLYVRQGDIMLGISPHSSLNVFCVFVGKATSV